MSQSFSPRHTATSLALNNLNPVTLDESSSSSNKKSVAFPRSLLGHRKITEIQPRMEHHHLRQEATINGNSFPRRPPLPNILSFLPQRSKQSIFDFSPFLYRLISSGIWLWPNFSFQPFRIEVSIFKSSQSLFWIGKVTMLISLLFQSNFRSLNPAILQPLEIKQSHNIIDRRIHHFFHDWSKQNHDIKTSSPAKFRSFKPATSSVLFRQMNQSGRQPVVSTLPVQVPSNEAWCRWSDIGEE